MTDVQTLQSPAEAARLFREILSAFATPATPVRLSRTPEAPKALHPASVALLLSLCDYQTPIWLAPGLDSTEARKFIRFHTGAPLARTAGEAAFAVAPADINAGSLDGFALGTHEYPDRSTTIILQTESLEGGAIAVIEGPGLKSPVSFAPTGTTAGLWQRLKDNAALVPIGFDVIFSSGQEIAALPRSMQISMAEAV